MTDTLHGAPETELWTTVLASWVKDAKRCRTKARARVLRQQCFTAWTARLCSMIDVDYGWFKHQIELILLSKSLIDAPMMASEFSFNGMGRCRKSQKGQKKVAR